MTEDERRKWEERYRRSAHRSPEEVAPELESFVDFLAPGRALDVATGRGRNALFLAERGWDVDAIDISRAALDRARDRAAADSAAVDWILADVDTHCFPEAVYDLVTVSYFDARERLPALRGALAPGGVLFYEHYLRSSDAERGPSDRYRFGPNELLEACSDLTIRYYVERREDGEPLVTLVAQRVPDGDEEPYPRLY